MIVNRKRLVISKLMNNLDLDYCSLASAKTKINELIKLYGDDARIEKYSEAYDDTEYLGIYKKISETDSEMADRISNEVDFVEEQEAREVAEFVRLTLKFKNK